MTRRSNDSSELKLPMDPMTLENVVSDRATFTGYSGLTREGPQILISRFFRNVEGVPVFRFHLGGRYVNVKAATDASEPVDAPGGVYDGDT